jgi:hypothetical protein
VSDARKLQTDLGAFHASRSARGLGQIDSSAPLAPASASAPARAAAPTLFTPRNVVIGAAVLGLGYLAATKTEKGREITENVASGFRRMVGGRSRRRAR